MPLPAPIIGRGESTFGRRRWSIPLIGLLPLPLLLIIVVSSSSSCDSSECIEVCEGSSWKCCDALGDDCGVFSLNA